MKAILIIVVPILLGLAIADETTNDDLEESTIMKALTPKPTTQPGVIMFVKPMKNNHTATHIKKMADDLTSASNPISWQLGFIPRKVKLSFFRFKRDVESSWKHARIQPRMWPPFYDLKDDPLTYPEKNGTSHQKPGYVKLLFVMVHHLWKDSAKYKLNQLMKGDFDGGYDDRK